MSRTYAAFDDSGAPLVVERWNERADDERGEHTIPCVSVCTESGRILDLSPADEEYWIDWCDRDDVGHGRHPL